MDAFEVSFYRLAVKFQHAMKLPIFLKERYFLLLLCGVLLAIGVTLRVYYYQTTFGYDMARDAFEAHSIAYHHDLKIMGPGTDIVGLNHGVLWYYVLAIPYALSHQDPQIAAIFFVILSLATIPVVWKLSFALFKDKTLSFVSTLLYAFSPLVIFLSSWMSNPVLCLYVSPPLLLLIWQYIHKPSYKKAFFIGLLYGMLIQSQLANVLLLLTIPLYILFFKLKFRFLNISALLLGLFISLLSYLIVEVKFHGRGIFGALEFLGGHHGGFPKIQNVLDKFIEFANLTAFPFHNVLTPAFLILFTGFIVFQFKANKKPVGFLLIWLINILLFTLFSTGVSTSSFVFVPSIAAGVILFSFVFVKILKKKAIIGVVLVILIFFQIAAVFKWQQEEFSPLAIPRSNTVYRDKQIVDYTYKSSQGHAFVINTLTVPLYINTTWAYVYEFYGKSKYGYVPFWGGRGQTGYLGSLPEKPFGSDIRYLILESAIGIPDAYVAKIKYDEEKISDLVEEKHFGYVIVQKRKFYEGKTNVPVPDILKNSNILYE